MKQSATVALSVAEANATAGVETEATNLGVNAANSEATISRDQGTEITLVMDNKTDVIVAGEEEEAGFEIDAKPAMHLSAKSLARLSIEDRAFLMERLQEAIRERDRTWLLSIWLNQRPNEVNSQSWIALGVTLADSGLVEHPDETIPIENIGRDFSIGAAGLRGWIMIVQFVVCTIKVDEDGCIIDLTMIGLNFTLSGFRHLETLKSLTLTGCETLAVEELSKLPCLRHLNLSGCARILSDFPMDMELKTLTDLGIDLGDNEPPQQFLSWLTKKRSLPNLEMLDFPGAKENIVSILVNSLCDAEASFREQLRGIGFYKSELEEKHLKRIVLELLPMYSNLYHLLLGANQIGSLRCIVECIEEGVKTNARLPVSSIRVLDIDHNPLLKVIKNEPREKKAMLRFLELFPAIRTLCTSDVDDEIKYALMKNEAGRRRIVEVGSDHHGRSQLPLCLSLWPLVLERAAEHWSQGRPDAPASKIFYLTRNAEEPAINASERPPIAARNSHRKRKLGIQYTGTNS